ncbi:hypothetical protein, partial [Spongiactinospora sp. TRM90649]|uniref:hypothetical protein n=1 Tax=Spongiactinospora sp. TRM90649 TaxID=3031114 RepID=UPI0023F993C9
TPRRPAPRGRHDGGERPPPARNGRRRPGYTERRQGGAATRWILAAAGLTGVVVVAVLLVRSGEPSGESATPLASTGVSSPATGGGQVPAGYTVRTGGTVSAAVPKDWRVTVKGKRVTFSAPGGTDETVTVETVAPAADGGIAALNRTRETTELAEYIQVRLEQVDYGQWKAAEWEYTHTQPDGVPMHTLARYVTVDSARAYRITFAIPELRWKEGAALRTTFFGTFAPKG